MKENQSSNSHNTNKSFVSYKIDDYNEPQGNQDFNSEEVYIEEEKGISFSK